MADLFAELLDAFPPRPIDRELLGDSTGMWNTYIHDQEFESGSLGQTWNTLSPAFVEYHCGALNWVNPEAFAVLLPAYLASLLRGDTENELPPLVLSQLIRRPGWEEDFDCRAARLTSRQHAVIIRVLEALEKLEKNESFLSRYRSRFTAALKSWRAVQSGAAPSSP